MGNKHLLPHDSMSKGSQPCAVRPAPHMSPQAGNPALGTCQRELGAVFKSSAALSREHFFQVSRLRNPLSEPRRICE